MAGGSPREVLPGVRWAGASSISQWPDPGTTSSVTLVAALRITTASLAPKGFSPPIASTGIVSFVFTNSALSTASWRIDWNWANEALGRDAAGEDGTQPLEARRGRRVAGG